MPTSTTQVQMGAFFSPYLLAILTNRSTWEPMVPVSNRYPGFQIPVLLVMRLALCNCGTLGKGTLRTYPPSRVPTDDGQMTPRGYPNFNSYVKNLRFLVLPTDGQRDGQMDRDINPGGLVYLARIDILSHPTVCLSCSNMF